jgi:predicted DNA-binding protein
MKSVRLSITMPAECEQTIRALAERSNSTISGVIRAAFKAYISEKKTSDVTDANVAILEAKIASLQHRINDKNEIIRAKDETIQGLKLFIKLEPEEQRERTSDTSLPDDFV